MPDDKKYTVITGAGSGLGKAFVLACAQRGHNVIMIALPGSPAQAIAGDIMAIYPVDVRVFLFDLTDETALKTHVQGIAANYAVDFLINNAGIGGTASFVTSTVEAIDKIILLNVRCTTLMTKLLLPSLTAHPKSYIINIASIAAFTPMAYKTVYPASKAFIASFSLGLQYELADKGVQVSVVYPGPIMTNSDTSGRLIKQGLKATLGLKSTDYIANLAINKTLAGKSIIVPGKFNRFNYYLTKFLPTKTKVGIISKTVKKEIQP
jgi:short-subunit dehydrogenase